jgi:signal transduction histidine kinase
MAPEGSARNLEGSTRARNGSVVAVMPGRPSDDAGAGSATAVLAPSMGADTRDHADRPCAAGVSPPTRADTERLAAVGLLSAGLMHEINNPLTAIIAYAQFLLKSELETHQRADVEHILIEAMRASRILQSLLTFARPMAPQKKMLDLNQAVASALAARRRELELDGVAVDVELKPGLPSIEADGDQLQQVFINIIGNARDAMLEHSTGQRRLSVATDARDGHVCVRFDDTGPGIPDECLGRIFDPFFTTKEVGRGTGLGLAVCHGIIRQHGGRISAANLPPRDGASAGSGCRRHRGARFVIELPAAKK